MPQQDAASATALAAAAAHSASSSGDGVVLVPCEVPGCPKGWVPQRKSTTGRIKPEGRTVGEMFGMPPELAGSSVMIGDYSQTFPTNKHTRPVVIYMRKHLLDDHPDFQSVAFATAPARSGLSAEERLCDVSWQKSRLLRGHNKKYKLTRNIPEVAFSEPWSRLGLIPKPEALEQYPGVTNMPKKLFYESLVDPEIARSSMAVCNAIQFNDAKVALENWQQVVKNASDKLPENVVQEHEVLQKIIKARPISKNAFHALKEGELPQLLVEVADSILKEAKITKAGESDEAFQARADEYQAVLNDYLQHQAEVMVHKQHCKALKPKVLQNVTARTGADDDLPCEDELETMSV